MSDKMRWRYGETNPVVAAVDAETVIEIGDLVWQDGDDAKPAADLDVPATMIRSTFAHSFLGVAMQRSRQGDSSPVRVATTGVFEFDYPDGDQFVLGELIAPCLLFGVRDRGMRLESQAVTKVAQSKLAIGRVARREDTPSRTVLVDIRSTVMTGGV